MRGKGFITTIIIVLVLAVVFLSSIADFFVNLQWFKEVGYLKLYFFRLLNTAKFMVPLFIAFFIGLWFYYKYLSKKFTKLQIVNNHISDKRERRILIVVDTVISLIISYNMASNYWYRFLQFTNAVDFNISDPLFNKDISFYVFKLPFVQAIYDSLLVILVLFGIITVVAYFIVSGKNKFFKDGGGIKSFRFSDGASKLLGRQLAILAAMILLFISLGYILKAYYLVYSEQGIVYGASYTDVNVTLLFYRVITILALAAAIIVLISLLRQKIKPIVVSIAVIALVIIIEPITASTVQRFVVKPNEYELEKKYIEYNIQATREAFNIDDIEEIPFSVDNNLTASDINDNKDIIDNLKVNSYKQVLDFYNQVQVIKNYYTFNDVDTDRYYINDSYNQVLISPREINSEVVSGVWQNKHLRYTHGYGITMSKVNSVTSEGQPDFVISNIPPENETNITLTNPRIYFGEKTDYYSIINTDLMEFDYPQGEDTSEFKYDGTAGIKLNLINKLLFSVYEGDGKILLSSAINSDSRIMINRNIIDRVQKLAPFLSYDKDPYLVISGGSLVWVIDAYTSSDKYPFSQYYGNVNYIRNSIKVTVDAYNGDVNFYIIDEEDPIAQSYAKIYEGLFKSKQELPLDIVSHFRYPADLFNLQCQVLNKYHVTNSFMFFTEEDMWQVSTANGSSSEASVNEANYVMTRLPDEEDTEMLLVEYFNIINKQNMSSILGARMDGDNYGKLVMYKFPTQKTVYSPALFMNKINQDTSISKELTLWDSKDSTVEYGDTLIIPINKSLLYIQPLYLKSVTENSIPEMKRVILFNGERIVIEESIDKALKALFDYETETPTDKPVDEPGTLEGADLEKAKELYNKAIEAQKNGDWAAYGQYIKELGDLLNGLE